jgi:hypothetical protein
MPSRHPVGGAVRAKITYTECHAIGSRINLAYEASELSSLICVQRASEICERLEAKCLLRTGRTVLDQSCKPRMKTVTKEACQAKRRMQREASGDGCLSVRETEGCDIAILSWEYCDTNNVFGESH